MLFTAFSPTNKVFLSSLPACFSPPVTHCLPLFLSPLSLPPSPFSQLAKTAKYIIRPLIAVTLTHPLHPPSTLLPPDSFQYCSPSPNHLLLSGLLAWALSRFEVALFIQPAWDVVLCGGVRGGRALFRWSKCQGLTSVKAKLCFFYFLKCSGSLQRLAAEVNRRKQSRQCGICVPTCVLPGVHTFW